jgi:hypothetical protein
VRARFREATAERCDEFVAKGHRRREVFAHSVYQLPKPGPDGMRLASWMCGVEDPGAIFELVLYAAPERLAGLPAELFFDDDIVWHQQQFGVPGQVASANIVVAGDTVHAMGYVSDLVQRIGRRREHKTQIEARFGGWRAMLLNAVLDFAAERGARTVRSATAALALRHTDPARDVQSEMFERVYDRAVERLLPARRAGDWWEIDMRAARERIVRLEHRDEARSVPERVICVYHDTERGRGHDDVDPAFAAAADRDGPAALESMLDIEARTGTRATYCVLGELLDEVRGPIEAGGHSVAFHSFDHRIEREDQLRRCRQVDYRIKGYRPPRSQITPELSDRNLLWHNFEWLANAARPLGTTEPVLRAGVVRLPVTSDDFGLHTGAVSYDDWEAELLAHARAHPFTAIGLHDCYAPTWIERYPALLERLGEAGELWTLDQVAAEVTLASAL